MARRYPPRKYRFPSIWPDRLPSFHPSDENFAREFFQRNLVFTNLYYENVYWAVCPIRVGEMRNGLISSFYEGTWECNGIAYKSMRFMRERVDDVEQSGERVRRILFLYINLKNLPNTPVLERISERDLIYDKVSLERCNCKKHE